MNFLTFSDTERLYSLGSETWQLGPLSFTIQKGEAIAIMGPSGSGKSTLLHLAGALERPSRGDVMFQDRSLTHMSEAEIRNYRNTEIGFVFQDFHLLPEFTLLENIALPLKISGQSKSVQRQKAEMALKKVGLDKKARHLPGELSGGERQRGAIARAIVHTPQILFADEPTGNLDMHTGEMIIQLLRNLHVDGNMTFVIATHDPAIAAYMQRTIFLEDGKVV